MYIRILRSISCTVSYWTAHEIAHGSLRMTIGEETTKEDMDYVVDNIKEIVTKLRTMSPLYEDFVKKNN